MKLRVHHLFCSALYIGKGYSEDFCRNMDGIVRKLWTENPHESIPRIGQKEDDKKVELVIRPDCICRECPNLTETGCSLDDDNVVSKDEKLAKRLGLEINRGYSVPELLHRTAANMTREIFETSCHNCEWYQEGLCSYERLAEKYYDYK